MVFDEILDAIAEPYTEIAKENIRQDMHYDEEKNKLIYEIDEKSGTVSSMRKMFGGYEMSVGNLSVIRQGIEREIDERDPGSVRVVTDLGWSKEIPMDGDPMEKADSKLAERYVECMPGEKAHSTLVSVEVIKYMENFGGEIGEDVIPDNL
ncbi:MAG: hypothetical protein ACLFTQ_02665 [Candidatus Aenigmatarchaeota archaeon]